jgi:hypothetical protein
MCNCRSEDQVEVCAVAADDIRETMSSVRGATLEVLPSGYILATNTIATEREAFQAAVDEAAAPYREQGAC